MGPTNFPATVDVVGFISQAGLKVTDGRFGIFLGHGFNASIDISRHEGDASQLLLHLAGSEGSMLHYAVPYAASGSADGPGRHTLS